GDNQASEKKDHGRREQTVAAEGVKNECLGIEQPKSDCEHRPHGKKEEAADPGVPEGGEYCETENTKIGDGTDEGERNSTNAGIWATQHLETVGRSTADHGLAGQGLDREIGCIGEAG